MYRDVIKRKLDIIGSTIALFLCFPTLLLIALAVKVELGKPVLFRQKRVGKDNQIFTLYKFRTMTMERDKTGRLLPNEARYTKLGSLLRSTSLDELPELINILKGDISFIGPRPLVRKYLPYYTDFELQRHKIKGGLIPPEVMYGEITPSWERQFEMDVDYVNHITFLRDVRILLSALRCIRKRISTQYGTYVRRSLHEERKYIKRDESQLKI